MVILVSDLQFIHIGMFKHVKDILGVTVGLLKFENRVSESINKGVISDIVHTMFKDKCEYALN